MKLPDRILEPGERISEILFGLIMALTVTGATSIVTADRFQIRTMLIAALGCNVAWGIIDAGMYLMARLIERGGNTLLLREIREAPDNQTAHRVIADALPPLLAAVFQPAQLELIREGWPETLCRFTGVVAGTTSGCSVLAEQPFGRCRAGISRMFSGNELDSRHHRRVLAAGVLSDGLSQVQFRRMDWIRHCVLALRLFNWQPHVFGLLLLHR